MRGQILPNSLARETYEANASFYDDLTAHHDYELWVGNLLPVLQGHGLRGSKMLDVGCGTGKSFEPMLRRDWQITGVDISPAMLARAARRSGGRAALSVGDVRALETIGEFDLVWCLDDVINCLDSQLELLQALAGLRRNLAPHGLLLFDLNTLRTFRTFFAEKESIQAPRGVIKWRGLGSARSSPGAASEARVEYVGADGAVIARARHRQRHFPISSVAAALEESGLLCLSVYGHGQDAVLHQPIDELEHTKAIVVSRLAERR